MTNEVITFNGFKSSALNSLAATLIQRTKKIPSNIREAQDLVSKALLRRYENGKDVYDHYDQIIEEVGSQREFASRIGITENMLSNDLRAFRHVKEEYGVDTLKGFTDLLDDKGIPLTVKMWEKLPSLLDNPDLAQKDRLPNDVQKVQNMDSELDEIVQRNEGQGHNAIIEEARQLKQRISDAKQHINKLNPYSYDWESPFYRKFCRELGMCMLTKEPCKTEFHHTDQFGSSGGEGTKLPDAFGIPINIELHRKIEDGKYHPTEMELATALIETLTIFIMNHYE